MLLDALVFKQFFPLPLLHDFLDDLFYNLLEDFLWDFFPNLALHPEAVVAISTIDKIAFFEVSSFSLAASSFNFVKANPDVKLNY